MVFSSSACKQTEKLEFTTRILLNMAFPRLFRSTIVAIRLRPRFAAFSLITRNISVPVLRAMN